MISIKIEQNTLQRARKLKEELNKVERKIYKQQEAFIEIAELIDTKNKSGIKGTLKSIFE